jgi:hypothetical protein
MSGSDNGYYGNTPIMSFEKLVNTPPTTDFEAMRMALVLAITAPSDEDVVELMKTVSVIRDALTDEELEAAKTAALLIVHGMDS